MAQKRSNTRAQVALEIERGSIQALEAFVLSEDIECAAAQDAILGLLGMDRPEAAEALAGLMIKAPVAVLEPAIATLAEQGGPIAMRALGEALSNPDTLVRAAAVRELASRGARSVVPLLLRASRDPSPAIGRRAERSLIRRVTEDPRILYQIRNDTAEGIIDLLDIDWAMELLSDAHPEDIRSLAALRLGKIGGEAATSTLAAMIEVAPDAVAEACWKALELSGSLSDHLLLPLLFNPSCEVRARVLPCYARFGDATGAGMLAGMTSEADPAVRREALKALGKLLGADALLDASRLAHDEDESVRAAALEILIEHPGAEPILLEVVGKYGGEARNRALGTLARRGVVTPDLVPHLMQLVLEGAQVTDNRNTEFLDSLTASAKALADSEAPEGLLALTTLCRSVMRRIRRVAIESIMSYPPEFRTDALDSLSDSYDRDVITNVALGLAEVDDPRAIVPLIRASEKARGRMQREIKSKLAERPEANDTTFLIESLTSQWVSVRRYGATSLKANPDPEAIPALLEASRDDDVEVQLVVLEALSPFAGTDDRVRERMIEAIGYGDITVRQAACEAVGEARCAEAVSELVKALVNCFLRPRAAEALRRIGDRKGILALKRIERREKMFPKKPKEALAKKGRSIV